MTGGNERILIVDDEEMLVELNKLRLSGLGYDVLATTSSTDALELFKKDPDSIDLVITDQSMPVLTGIELAAEMLKIRAEIPIVLYAGYSQTISQEKAEEAGIRTFLVKPTDFEEVAKTIRSILDTRGARIETVS